MIKDVKLDHISKIIVLTDLEKIYILRAIFKGLVTGWERKAKVIVPVGKIPKPMSNH